MRNVEEMMNDGNEKYSDAKCTTSFRINHCPNNIYEEFTELAKVVGENSYWMTLKILMDNLKRGAMYDYLCSGLDNLEKRVAVLELIEPTPKEEDSDPEFRTLGQLR